MAPGKASSLAFDASTVIVVTGSNRSLGFHLTKAFLETTESHVVATARNIDKADALRELAAKFSDRVQLVQLDTENEDSVKVLLIFGHACIALAYQLALHRQCGVPIDQSHTTFRCIGPREQLKRCF